MSSRAWFVDRYGGPGRLTLRRRDDPVPGPDEVLVRVAAIGLNFADLFVRAGVYPRTPSPPFVPGMEVSGTVEAAGPQAAGIMPGQRVVAVPIFGGHAEKVVCPASRTFPIPEGADLLEAAAMPVAFLTAHHALDQGRVEAGERVVVTAAAGGVGTALLQVARLRGARSLALVGSAGKLAVCRELGAEAAGLYGQAPELLERHFGGGADAVLDAVGGELFRPLWKSLAAGGRYVLYGFASAAGGKGLAPLRAARALASMGMVSPFGLISSCRSLIGFNLSLLPGRTAALRGAADAIFTEWRSGRIRPILGPQWDFEALPEAHRALASRATTGKILIRVGV